MNYILYFLWLVSILILPWWIFVPAGIYVASLKEGAYVVVAGGVLADALFGVPMFGISVPVLYTVLFTAVALGRMLIEDRLLV